MIFSDFLPLFQGKRGIEVGGPSGIFRSEIPVYAAARVIDGVNFSAQTVWGQFSQSSGFRYSDGRSGDLFIREATDLIAIADSRYDFLLASHVLEHCANPIKALHEWRRVIGAGRPLLLVLPRAEFTFDHRREVTPFAHLIEDAKNNVGEDDLTHLEEIIASHDLSRDIEAGSIENFTKRSQRNFENRCLHHHVFDFSLLSQLISHAEMRICGTLFITPYHQIVIAIKS